MLPPSALGDSTRPLSGCLYVSTASDALKMADLDRLLEQSQSLNSRDGISGVLFFGGGSFAQYFEGSEVAVESLKQRLLRDRRHFDMTIVVHSPIVKRRFSNWTMGFLSGETTRSSAAFGRLQADDRLREHLLEMGSGLERVIQNFYLRITGDVPIR